MIRVVALGGGSPEAVPAVAVSELASAPRVLAPDLPPGLAAVLPVAPGPMPPLDRLPADAVVAAPDPEAHRLARALPAAETVPERDALRARAIGAEVARLAEVGATLRRECPWDREQTAETIVPHTIEEAFEVAEAVAAGRGLADELGDLLFQPVFLARLLEEGHGPDLAEIARGQADKLVGRHPHVYGDAAAESAAGVVDLWERRKREERAGQGLFHDLPAGLPALAYATKAQRRAAAVGFDHPDAATAVERLGEELDGLRAEPGARALGDVLFAAVAAARQVGADPEIALRSSALRFRERVERAARLAAEGGDDFEGLGPEEQLRWFERAGGAAG